MKLKINKNKVINMLVLSFFFVLMFSTMAFAADDASANVRLKKAFETFFGEYKFQLSLFIAVSIVSSILAFIYNITRIGVYSDNADLRQSAIRNTLISAGCTMALGSLETIISLIFHITMFSS